MSVVLQLTKLVERAKINTHLSAAAAAAATAILGITVLPRIYRNYTTWHNLGPAGAVPRNVLGWLAQGLAYPIAYSDPLSTSVFKKHSVIQRYGPTGQSSFLSGDGLRVREGTRPHVPAGFIVVPQRQTVQRGSEEMIREMESYLRHLAAKNPERLKVDSSVLEGVGNPALFIANGKMNPLVGGGMRGEIIHRHGEGSSHMVLSLSDAEAAITNGWSQRFRLSDVFLVPATYVMVYAPRNEEELRVWKSLALASVRFILAHDSIQARES